jgi:glucose/arabinose dehydrogenase
VALGCACAAQGAAGAKDVHFDPVRVVVDGLRDPVQAVPAPSGRADRVYVVEQRGQVLIADGARLLKRPFLDLRRVVAHGGLRGLLSLAFDPRYLANGRAYVDYVGRDHAVYVDEIRTMRGYAASRRVLLRIPASSDPDGHFGGDLVFGRDGCLYVSMGDGDDPAMAQDQGSFLGKIVRLRVHGPSAAPTVVAWGLRNPWRFSFTPDGSALVIGDVGASRREEIDVLPRRLFGRANFGWPLFEGTLREAPSAPDRRGVLVAPFVEYPHRGRRCYAVVGGFVYRGSLFPRVRGRYLYGDLCGGMWSVRLSGRRAQRPRAEPFFPGGILTSIDESANRDLLLVSGDGRVVSPVPR